MKTLIVGIGALGGIIGGRLHAHDSSIALATRDAASADELRASGLRISGIGGEVFARPDRIAPLADYDERFDLIVLATKAHAAIELAPRLIALLEPDGTLLPIQNGGVPQLLAERFGQERVLGGLSNLGATIIARGVFEQRNAGHLLIGEMNGGLSARVERVRASLGRGPEVRVTANLRGGMWSKLLINCSVTTLGAVAGCTMRQYIDSADGRAIFVRAYDEALAVALATGATPERMLVEPIPPDDRQSGDYDAWLATVLAGYGDLKPSMLHDFERGQPTEIDFINGYVAELGKSLNVATPVNRSITSTVHAIERGEEKPNVSLLGKILRSADAL